MTDSVDADAATRAREARYAEAIDIAACGSMSDCSSVHDRSKTFAVAVVPLADAEQAELRAEVERTKRGARELGRILDRTLRDALDASGRLDAIDEDGDGDWAVVWETLSELRPRAEAAEAELRALREGIEALADEFANEDTADLPEWGGDFERGAMWAFAEASRLTRALLASSPAATTGEGGHVRTSTSHGPDFCKPCSEALGDWVAWPCDGVSSGEARPIWVSDPAPGGLICSSCLHPIESEPCEEHGTSPTPVSSGEAGTGEAVQR